jgi:hypothetical protein
MVLRNNKFKTFFILLIITIANVYALEYEKKKELPEMATKQAINNLRFISKDGKFTYYQRRSGSLLLSTNYKIQEILKGAQGSQYLVSATHNRKKIIITQDENFHNFYAIRKPLAIFVSDFGSLSPRFIAKGINPKLHMKDSWISWYNPQARKLHFLNLRNKALNFNILLSNTKNPYFIPEVIMTSDNLIYYTDLNKKGTPGLIEYDRKNKNIKAILKGNTPSEKIELCLFNDQLYIAEFSINSASPSTTISSAKRYDVDSAKRRIIYESNKDDLGNMLCSIEENSLYFIKNTTESGKVLKYEAAHLNVTSKKIKILSNVNYATSIINMDGRLILPYREKLYVLLGEHNLATIDQLDKKQEVKK